MYSDILCILYNVKNFEQKITKTLDITVLMCYNKFMILNDVCSTSLILVFK